MSGTMSGTMYSWSWSWSASPNFNKPPVENVGGRDMITLWHLLVLLLRKTKTMNHDAIQELLRRQPFEPFEIRLTNGERHEVRHPGMALLLQTRIVIALPEDRMVICPLRHIASVETLQSVEYARSSPDVCNQGERLMERNFRRSSLAEN